MLVETHKYKNKEGEFIGSRVVEIVGDRIVGIKILREEDIRKLRNNRDNEFYALGLGNPSTTLLIYIYNW